MPHRLTRENTFPSTAPRLPTTYKRGISAPSALAPSRQMTPRISAAQKAMQKDAVKDTGSGGALFPRSHTTGAARKAFMPTYSSVYSKPRELSAMVKSYSPPFSVKAKATTKTRITGTSTKFTLPMPPIPLRQMKNTAASTAAERTGTLFGMPNASKNTLSIPASMVAHMTKQHKPNTACTAGANF